MKKQQLYILAGLGLVLFVGVSILVWKNTSREPRESIQDQVIQQVSEQSQSAVQHEADPEVVAEESYPQHIVAISGSDQVWYEIPELGIRMKLNKEFAEDLVYSASSPTRASFEKKSIIAVAPECEPSEGGEFNGMSLYLVFGTVGDADKRKRESGDTWGGDYATLLKYGGIVQLPDFFIVMDPIKADACWNSEHDAEARKSLNHKYNGSGIQNISDIFKYKVIQSIPKK